MAYDQSNGTSSLRASFYDPAVKQIAARMYKFKQALTVLPSDSWLTYYYQESTTELTGLSPSNTGNGIPRGGSFPSVDLTWQQQVATMKQYGLEQTIYHTDVLSNNIDIRNRTVIRLASGVSKFVDDGIFTVLSESLSPTNINSVTIAAGYEWNAASAAIIDDLENAEQQIAEYNYDTSNLYVFINPKAKRSIVKFLFDKGAQVPNITDKTLNSPNGSLGTLGNKTFIVSNSVTASYALVCVPKICGTGRQLEPLKTITKEDEGRTMLVRTWEYFVSYLTDPKAVCLIKNTTAA